MAKYGNILAIFTNDATTKTNVEKVLTNNSVIYVACRDLYFVETTSMTNTAKVISQLKVLGIDFLFFHNHIADGSQIRANGIDTDILVAINKIMFT